MPVSGAPVVEGAAHGLLAIGAIHAIPAVEIHADAAYGEHRAAGEPRGRSIAPHHGIELLRLTGIDGAIDLTEQVARRRAGLVGSTRGQESVLSPTGADEGARVLPQHALRVRQRERIIGAHLDEEVAPGPPLLESVDLEGRQLLKARWLLVRQASRSKNAGPKPKVTVKRDGAVPSSGSVSPSAPLPG